MKIATIALIGATVLSTVSALAQQDQTGTLTIIDRIDRNVVIQRPQNGTVGASTGASEVLKAPSTLSLDNVHVGDKVTYTATDAGGIKTLTKLEKQ
jgi:hypothetical protein